MEDYDDTEIHISTIVVINLVLYLTGYTQNTQLLIHCNIVTFTKTCNKRTRMLLKT